MSTDLGASWQAADVEPYCDEDLARGGQAFGWVRWRCRAELPPFSRAVGDAAGVGEGGPRGYEVWCRATDVEGRCQPPVGLRRRDKAVQGYFYNGWHRVRV